METEPWFLRSLREELRLNQEDIAKDSNLTQGKISAFERGAEIPREDECAAIVNPMVRRAAVRGLEILILERR
jgi:transcriptional regulator with XRE-family HTH domain